MENLLDCHGRRFRAKIAGVKVGGKISVDGEDVFLCQDEMDGYPCEDRLGYRYSWAVVSGSEKDLKENDVKEFYLVGETPSEYKDWQVGDKVAKENILCEVIFRSGELVVLRTQYDKASENYTCDELFEEGWRLVVEEDLIELTLEDVAKMKGVSVDRIRIKE
jgi:hypothetical protein